MAADARGDPWQPGDNAAASGGDVIQRSGLLPKPIYRTFDDEEDGDVYACRVEPLLDRGVVPEEFAAPTRVKPAQLRASIIEYRETQAVSAADGDYLVCC
jgi:hypothetical protein